MCKLWLYNVMMYLVDTPSFLRHLYFHMKKKFNMNFSFIVLLAIMVKITRAYMTHFCACVCGVGPIDLDKLC